MKKLLTLLTITTAGLLTVPATVSAADEKPKTDQAREGREGRRDRLEMMKEQLNLTPEQVEKIKPIVEAGREKMKAVREDSTLAQDAKREKMRELAKTQSEEIKPILTAEQQTKWQELMAKRRERAGTGAEEKK